MTKRLTQLILYAILTCSAIVLFWEPLCSIIDTVLLPLFSSADNDKPLIAIASILCVCSAYILRWNILVSEEWFSFRRILFLLIVFALVFFRFYTNYTNTDYFFTGLLDGKVEYLAIVLVEIILLEIISRIPKIKEEVKKRKKSARLTSITPSPFLPDTPTEEDKYDRKRYAELLVDKIITSSKQSRDALRGGSFNILLSECYGYGKSSFLLFVERECEKQKIDFVTFRPWLCDNPDQIVGNFFSLLIEKLASEKFLRKLLQVYADTVTNGVSHNVAKVLLGMSNNDSIETQHDNISKQLIKLKSPKVIAIDDVDRLQYNEIVSLVKLIRNTADFPNIFYIIAADKQSILQIMKTKGGIENPELYLQKFFNHEMILPATEEGVLDTLFNATVKDIVEHYNFNRPGNDDYSGMIASRSIRLGDVFRTPRDIYRFANILTFDLDALNSDIKGRNGSSESIGDDDICLMDLMRLSIIKYLRPDVYKVMRDNSEDCYLDYMPVQEQLAIADKYKEFFENRFSKRLTGREDMSSLQIDFSGTYSNVENTTHKDCSFEELIQREKPSIDDIVKEMFVLLWSKEIKMDHRPTINKNYEFFKYFAGRLRNNEVTTYETRYHFQLDASGTAPSETFVSWLKNNISNNKGLSVRQKLQSVLEKGFDENKRYSIIFNTLYCIDLFYKKNIYKITDAGLFSFYIHDWNSIINDLLASEKNDVSDDFYNSLSYLITKTDNMAIVSLFLYSIKSYNYRVSKNETATPCVISAKQHMELADNLTNRFFREVFNPNPYDEKTLELIPCIRLSNSSNWISNFQQHLELSKDINVWIFGLFCLADSGLCWNYFVLESIVHSGIGSIESIERLFGEHLNDEYKACLKAVPEPDGLHMRNTTIRIDDNKLLIDAEKWLKSGRNPFPEPEWIK